ncbi:hypothetical protein NP210_24855, partial [Salmonella enterica]|nr:hypothetical protein [Salmonella enterica]
FLQTFLVEKKGKLLFLDPQSNIFSKLYLQYIVPRVILGLIVNKIKGIICRIIRVASRVWVGGREMMCGEILPRWVVINM